MSKVVIGVDHPQDAGAQWDLFALELLWVAGAVKALVVLLGHDSLPEWSKGVDSSSTSASCVGSNLTAVRLRLPSSLALLRF